VTSDPAPAFADGVEKIDIGGPTMIRAAAKNHAHVMVVVDPADYPEVLRALAGEVAEDEVSEMRRKLAWKAFQHCASYDSQVAEWMWNQVGGRADSLVDYVIEIVTRPLCVCVCALSDIVIMSIHQTAACAFQRYC
jgi:AICAR transformylase/IMP cyclohydrolase PurH